jgi:hypothetical protein
VCGFDAQEFLLNTRDFGAEFLNRRFALIGQEFALQVGLEALEVFCTSPGDLDLSGRDFLCRLG